MTTVGIDTRVRERWVYVWIAGLCLAIAVGAFWPSYWGPLANGTFVKAAPVMHVHGLLFTAWPLLFLKQTWLAGTGGMGWPRGLGLLCVALAVSMVFAGLLAALDTVRLHTALSDAFRAHSFAIVPV